MCAGGRVTVVGMDHSDKPVNTGNEITQAAVGKPVEVPM